MRHYVGFSQIGSHIELYMYNLYKFITEKKNKKTSDIRS